MPVSYDKLKERYKPQMLYYVNRSTHLYRNVYSMRLRNSIKPAIDFVNINSARAVLTPGIYQCAISRV